MAKRHPSLVALSHDHHHGLALALRLRQGDNALLTDGWVHDRHEQARRVADFHQKELRRHFLAEEKVLFPAMRRYVPAASELIDRLVLQHRQLEEIIDGVSTSAPGDLSPLLVRFGEVLELHIRAEERELFPIYEEHVPDKAARHIQVEMDTILDPGGGDSHRRKTGEWVTSKRQKGLLIVEDEDDLRVLLAAVLEGEGFKVFQAQDGQYALDTIREHMEEIDVVVSDLGLPRLSGLDLIHEARRLKPSLKIIGASGYGRVNVREEVLKAGGDEFHPKPFIAEDLINAIKNLMGEQ